MGRAFLKHIHTDTDRVADLRRRVRKAMEEESDPWKCPERIDDRYMGESPGVRRAHAIALKLAHMPTDHWQGQLIAGSMTFEEPRIHAERGFPAYNTEEELAEAKRRGIPTSPFGHIVPDYPKLLKRGLNGILADVGGQRLYAQTAEETAFLDSVVVALEAVMAYAERVADRLDADAEAATDVSVAIELRQMAENLRQVPAGPAQTFWEALQSVWLLHMIFHATRNGNALGRADQYLWPYLEADLEAGRLDLDRAGELLDCFCLKFNERAKATEEQRPEARSEKQHEAASRTRHKTSSQVGTRRDQLDATNHWLQNIIIGGLTPEGEDGTNPLTFLLMESYRRNQMTNPLLTVRVHKYSPEMLMTRVCEVLKDGGGMPAIFNDDALVPALEKLGFPTPDARDYTNDGCWEVIIPGRTDFCFQRLSLMLCLERALNRGKDRLSGEQNGPDTGDPRGFGTFDDVWQAFQMQIEAMVSQVVDRVVNTRNDRNLVVPVPLLSALTEGAIENRCDMTAGGAKFRSFGMLAESASHAIDSLTAIQKVVFEDGNGTMSELCDALDADYEGYEGLQQKLLNVPHYGNDDPNADAMGQRVMEMFQDRVDEAAGQHDSETVFPCGVATFSWYVGIGQGLGSSPDGRAAGGPVASNFSPALGRDQDGICGAILSYSKMHHDRLAAGGPIDLRLARRLVKGAEGTARMVGILRSLVDLGGSMMTLTVADTEELRAAQREPEKYRSLRVRMGGWCAYFTMLSREQQEHHIRRQEARS